MCIVFLSEQLGSAGFTHEAVGKRLDWRHDEELCARENTTQRAGKLAVGRAHRETSWMGPNESGT
jgi:hypothetical protein